MKLLVIASALDVSLPLGCTAAWWQLLKALAELGHEIVAAPYFGRAVSTLWWRSYENPCYRLGQVFQGLRELGREWTGDKRADVCFGDSAGQRFQRALIQRLVTPRWRRHLASIVEREGGVSAVLILNVPLNHFGGIASSLRRWFGLPICYFDGDLPASLPEFGGFASGFSIYHGADLAEYDGVLGNSQGSLETLGSLGARRTGVLWWGADPELFRPLEVEEDIDVFFYGLGSEYRQDWLDAMIAIPSRRLPSLRFVVAGDHLDLDLGRAERLGGLLPSQLNRYAARARLNLNVARRPHASVYASASTRLFELASMQRAVVSNPVLGLNEWFEPGSEIEVVGSADSAVAAYVRLLENAGERKALGEAARRRLMAQHTYRHRAQQLVTFLQSLREPSHSDHVSNNDQ